MNDEDELLRQTLVDEEAPQAAAPSSSACLVVISGDDLGKRIPFERGTLVFGRDHACDVPLDDDTVSRRHAELLWAAGTYMVRDLGSTNGTFLNDQPIRGGAVLGDGDRVAVGRTIFKFLQSGNVEAEYHEVIYRLMTNDGLTGACNKRSFEQALVREVGRAARYDRDLALILFDIDRFKQVNDEHGHLVGDELLRQPSARVNERVRGEDLFARVGGEEFAVLLPEGTLVGAKILADRLRVLIAYEPFEIRGHNHQITCSFGVASIRPARGQPAQDLYRLADARLYAAKAAGRNCVVFSG